MKAAKRGIAKALAVDTAPLPDEHRELLADTMKRLRDLLAVVDLKFLGAATADWDAELTKLMGPDE